MKIKMKRKQQTPTTQKIRNAHQTAMLRDGPDCDGFACECPGCEILALPLEFKLFNIICKDTLILRRKSLERVPASWRGHLRRFSW